MSDNLYVILKLTSGEQVMAVLKEEDDNYVLLEDPMAIRTVPIFEAGKEHIIANPLCHFSDDNVFVIPKRNILFVKRLQSMFVPHYIKLVKQHQENAFVPKTEDDSVLEWEETPTPEEARKMIKQLKNVFGDKKEDEINWEEKMKMMVPGNDTIN